MAEQKTKTGSGSLIGHSVFNIGFFFILLVLAAISLASYYKNHIAHKSQVSLEEIQKENEIRSIENFWEYAKKLSNHIRDVEPTIKQYESLLKKQSPENTQEREWASNMLCKMRHDYNVAVDGYNTGMDAIHKKFPNLETLLNELKEPMLPEKYSFIDECTNL